MDYWTLADLRKTHSGWRLLAAEHAPLIVSFLSASFTTSNVRTLAQGELVARLEDHLFQLRERKGNEAFPRAAAEYLDEWAADKHGWLRKYYPSQGDEPHFDLTPATEKAIEWITSLRRRPFIGTESRLMTVFALLRELSEGTQLDVETRIAELERRRKVLDEEIARARAGTIDVLDATRIRDRFQQVETTARGLLTDFREVEQNFRELDRAVRERIAAWEGGRGALLKEVFGERDAISSSDQGRSFGAFWDFLMSDARQEEFTDLLSRAFELEAVKVLAPDPRLRRIHDDWLTAGQEAQRTVARLSEQLRRFLDDKALLENRRIMELLKVVEQHALAIRLSPPEGAFMELDDVSPEIELAMDRPLFSPPFKARLVSRVLSEGEDDSRADALYDQVFVDKARLATQVRRLLQTRPQVSLAEIIAEHPLDLGLAELVAYLTLASEDRRALIDETRSETLAWTDDRGVARTAILPLVVFSRASGS